MKYKKIIGWLLAVIFVLAIVWGLAYITGGLVVHVLICFGIAAVLMFMIWLIVWLICS